MEEFKKALSKKWVLFDTNILLKASRHPKAFLPVLTMIKEMGCQPVYFELVKAEFLQSVWQPELIESQEKFLEDMRMQSMPMRPIEELTKDVLVMTRKLRASKKPLPDLVDSYATALVKKHSSNLILLTMNHKDFAFNLERFYVLPIEISEQEIVTIGFYKSK